MGQNNKYRLLSKLGVLNVMYPVNQLLRVPQDSGSLAAAELLHAPSDTRTTLKTVAAANANGDKVAVKCNCKKDCSSGRCK